jgi:GNAT superfamily N-acetyltransferase
VRVRIPPRALTIRRATAADARAIAGVHVASWRVGYRGLVSQQKLDRLDVDEREQRWKEWIGDAMHEALREHGRTEATLWVFADNHAARAFYAAHGYAPDGASASNLGLDTLRLSAPLASSQQRLSPG